MEALMYSSGMSMIVMTAVLVAVYGYLLWPLRKGH